MMELDADNAPTLDWEPLGEDVSMHTVQGPFRHDDGRSCVYHFRLDAWAFGWPTDKRCLRDHTTPQGGSND